MFSSGPQLLVGRNCWHGNPCKLPCLGKMLPLNTRQERFLFDTQGYINSGELFWQDSKLCIICAIRVGYCGVVSLQYSYGLQ
jgi:hypothetical protein